MMPTRRRIPIVGWPGILAAACGTHRGDSPCVRTLFEGVKRYEATKRARYSERFAALANGQEPDAMFITCSDSRVVPSLVALADPGELFVVRNVANLVAPSGDVETGDTSAAAAVWYALEVLNIKELVVCGHSGCGGMKALLGPPPPSQVLRRWLAPAARAVETWRENGPLDPYLDDHDQLSQVATLQQIENLETHDCVRARVESGNLRLHAWWFDIPAARLLGYSHREERYVPILAALDTLESCAAAE